MPIAVFLAEDAERDIEDIHRYIARHGGQAIADRILDGIEAACRSLATLPERGNVPKELVTLGITEFRETRFKPYRIIYRVLADRVIVYTVLDGRRDMQTLLLHRLTR